MRKIKYIFFFALIFFCLKLAAGEKELFNKYAYQDINHGIINKIDWNSHPLAAKYTEELKTAEGKAADFAAEYRVVLISCGSSCQQIALVQIPQGKVLITDITASNGIKTDELSRLMIVNPGQHPLYKTEYYLMEDGKLKKIINP